MRAARCLASLGMLLLCACGGDYRPPKVTVVNDVSRPVTLEYCRGQDCAQARRLDLAAGEEQSYPLVDVPEGGSVDLIRITDGRDEYCLLVPPREEGDDDGYRVTLSTFRDPSD